MTEHPSNVQRLVSITQAVRLYNVAKSTNAEERRNRKPSISSKTSTPPTETAETPICRICRWERPEKLLQVPCSCKGSLGYVHSSCLHRWHYMQNTSICEICQQNQNLCLNISIQDWFWNIYKRRKYLFYIVCDSINLASITLVACTHFSESFEFLERLAPDMGFTLRDVIYLKLYLGYTGFYLYHYFDWMVCTIIKLRKNLLRLAWSYDDDFFEFPDEDESDDSSLSWSFYDL